MSTRKNTGKHLFNWIPFFFSKDKGRKKRTQGLSTTLFELGLNQTVRKETHDTSIEKGSTSAQHLKNQTDKKGKKNWGTTLPAKDKRKKGRTESVSKTLHDLGLHYSPTQAEYARTRASVKKENEKQSISSSLSSSLPVSLL